IIPTQSRTSSSVIALLVNWVVSLTADYKPLPFILAILIIKAAHNWDSGGMQRQRTHNGVSLQQMEEALFSGKYGKHTHWLTINPVQDKQNRLLIAVKDNIVSMLDFGSA
ncbi:hypothetical protein ACJX0J_024752, partial [Zea mays]